MNRIKLLTIAVIGLLIINAGTLAFILLSAHPGPPPPRGRHGEGPKQIIIDRLGFNNEQQKKYEALIKEHHSKSMELNERSRELHNELFSLLKHGGEDKKTADDIILKISMNQQEIDRLNYTHFEQIRALCQGDQVAKFNELADELARLFAPPGPPPGH